MQNKSYDTATRITLPAPAGGVKSGGFYRFGMLFGCAVSTVAAGKPFTLDREGIWGVKVEAGAGNAVETGEPIYWTAGRADAEFTNVAEDGALQVGYAGGAVAAGQVAEIDVIIEPSGVLALSDV